MTQNKIEELKDAALRRKPQQHDVGTALIAPTPMELGLRTCPKTTP